MDVFSLILSDDEELEPQLNGSLSDIFGAGQQSDQNPKSLRYQPPKPSFPGEGSDESPESKDAWQVLIAKVVTAFKVVNHLQENRGKIGFALLLKTNNDLKMVLYRTKQEVLSTTLILENFYIFVKDNYLQFADDIGAFWSILFETELDKDSVLKVLDTRCKVQIDERSRSFDSRHDLDEIKVEKTDTDPEEKQSKHIKANILSRMAKMGKKIVLPSKMTSNSEMSDNSSDNDGKGDAHKSVKPNIPPRKHNNRHHNNNNVSSNNVPQLQIAQIAPGPMPQQVGPISTFNDSHIIPQFLSTQAEANLNLMLSENRIQNTEIRFNLSKLENKVEKILDRVDLLNSSSSNASQQDRNHFNRDEEMIELEEKMLALKKENLNLKFKIRDLEMERESSSPRKTSSNLDEFDENELKNDNESLRKLNQNISLELERFAEEMKSLEQKIDDNNSLMEAKDLELKAKDSQIEDAIRQLEDFKIKLETEERQNLNLQKQLQEVSSNVSKLELHHLRRPDTQEMCSQTDNLNDNNNNHSNNELIKEIMNNLYFKLCDRIQNLNENEMKQSEILKNIGQTIKQETNEALRKTKGDS